MSPISILYVDDEPINLMLFEKMFSRKYKVLTAESGFKGLDILNENQDLNLVISDMKMPGLNGLEFISKAKQFFPDIQYYILTGYEITTQIQEALDSGLIRHYFRKPFNMSEIEKIIENNIVQ